MTDHECVSAFSHSLDSFSLTRGLCFYLSLSFFSSLFYWLLFWMDGSITWIWDGTWLGFVRVLDMDGWHGWMAWTWVDSIWQGPVLFLYIPHYNILVPD
ncbi:hypothetical protein BO94DRAFT_352131 [Aspergillus sclerotioniger CBS 115572]|uniref:Uncharacterized protein n=1 Tax=Aspergillus sclerotioniger CBS 115572 TaxID=1450535 RepID=A0A317XB60_9EURO|nr:hypothetical protein BO94DRAFT_352131 [Aspergillus sclerotioniger CBS 115572]PWY93770.1 hypothetical protein BO94DRAFT_352131 [Aspergillus sclerotioniger CBS 115572]